MLLLLTKVIAVDRTDDVSEPDVDRAVTVDDSVTCTGLGRALLLT
jgi:hypothetical protein